jgi:CheY-like chemotaxis protein
MEKKNEGVCLHFSVRDTGIGIARERQKAVFDAFTQADTSTTRKHGGTGLGLTITSSLAALMNGRMWIESERGKGSVFHFTAMFASVANGTIDGPAQMERSELRGLRVLVVDDNQTSRCILKDILLSWGLKPTITDGGYEALATLEHAQRSGNPFELLLTDLQMPMMNGFGLVERVRQNPELAGATIMMLTSSGEQAERDRCLELGVKAYLNKPIRQSALRQAILSAMRSAIDHKVQPAVAALPSTREAKTGLRILLAEDNPVNQVLAKRLLDKMGHTVVIANNGVEALKAIQQMGPFDAALMDVQMPEMDGFEATRAVREIERESGNHLPIIALTAHAMKRDEERCLAAGMDGYISKPIRVADLFAILERWALGKLHTEDEAVHPR